MHYSEMKKSSSLPGTSPGGEGDTPPADLSSLGASTPTAFFYKWNTGTSSTDVVCVCYAAVVHTLPTPGHFTRCSSEPCSDHIGVCYLSPRVGHHKPNCL